MIKSAYIIPVIVLFLCGCQQDLIIDLPDPEPKVTVNAMFPTDSLLRINLSKSRGPLDDTYTIQYFNSASVIVYENGILFDSLILDSAGDFASSKHADPGKTYSIVVNVNGYPEVTASDAVPQPAVFDNIIVRDSALNTQFGGMMGEIALTLHDPAVEHNYYGIEIYVIDTFEIDSGDMIIEKYPIYFSSIDPLVTESAFFDDVTFEGQSREIKINIEQYYLDQSTEIHLVIMAISKNGYDYQKSFWQYQNTSGNPFAEPVQIKSNIVGGYGIFTGFVRAEQVIR